MSASQTAWMQRYRADHREEYNAYMRDFRKKNREAITTYERQYRIDHPEYRKSMRHRYRARLRSAHIGVVDIKKLIKDWDGVCGICLLVVEGDYHIDHIVALANGGPHSQENLQLTHPTCNIRKGARQ